MSDLWASGFSLMVLGMGTVFVFLTLLVISTSLMSSIVGRFFPEKSAPDATPNTVSYRDAELAAVAAAAVHASRSQN